MAEPTKLLESPRPAPGDRIEDLDTPTILVDLDRLERNLREWQSAMNRAGVRFRAHIKTHKIPEIGVMQIAAGAVGIICAKVSEAEPFAAAGIDDICIAYPVVGEQKWRRIADLARRGVRMTVNCDSDFGARQASEAATGAGVTINLQIDTDSGMHRGGSPIDDADAVEGLARSIARLPSVEFDGLTTHRGLFFEGVTTPEEAGRQEGELLVELAEKLRARGVEVREVTAGGTFTGRSVAEVPGVTESRAGTYVFYDLMHLTAGTATEDQLALSAQCTVVSHLTPDRITIDGGSKTFSGDRGVVGGQQSAPTAIAQAVDRQVYVDRLTEEHGMAKVEEAVELGEKIRFYPFHACTCANLSNEIVGFRNGRVEKVWPVLARGLRT